MFRKLVSLLIALSFLLIGTAAFTVAAELQQAPPPQTPITTKPAPARQPVLLPDLVVVDTTVINVALNAYNLSVDVRNQGSASARPCKVKVVYEWMSNDGSKNLREKFLWVGGLAAGSTTKISTPVIAGTMYDTAMPKVKEVFVDSENSVAESNEGNNKVTY